MAVQAAQAYDWWLDVDHEGFREYHVLHQVQTTTPLVNPAGAGWTGDGPNSILGATGLPNTGDTWVLGNDNDPWAFCRPYRRVRPIQKKKGDPYEWYSVESIYSNKPLNRCMTTDTDDPLDEPQKVRGNSIRHTIEAFKDRFGLLITNSAHELYRGPQVEFDGGRDQVIIEQNVAALELNLCTSLRNSLNDDTLWGLAPRRVKLSDFSWEELWYGTCTHYYRRKFVFDIRNDDDDLFDRVLLDEGTKVLNGRWLTQDELTARGADCDTDPIWIDLPICAGVSPKPSNPQHFRRYKDRWGENSRVVLDGKGRPASSSIALGTGTYFGTGTLSTDEADQRIVEKYNEADLTQLNIPADLDFGTEAS